MSEIPSRGRRPATFRLAPGEPEPVGQSPIGPPAPSPSGRRAPRALPVPPVEATETEPAAASPAEGRRARPAPARSWSGLLFAALGTLIALAAGAALADLIESLFARAAWLGWLASGLLGLAAFAALMIMVREALGLLRLQRLTSLHAEAERANRHNDRDAARRALEVLRRLYSGRADAAWGLAQLKAQEAEIIDPGDRLRLAERDLLAPLDAEAVRVIADASRRVGLLTTVTPAAAFDVLFVAAQNLAMLRALATLYGGRPGTLGTWRLARMVLAHLAVTGGLAMTDSLVQHVLGHGLVGRLSARLGEGAVNGILTARIGLAALDLVRPLPFLARRKPSLADFVASRGQRSEVSNQDES